jgi:hypothetical protein
MDAGAQKDFMHARIHREAHMLVQSKDMHIHVCVCLHVHAKA